LWVGSILVLKKGFEERMRGLEGIRFEKR